MATTDAASKGSKNPFLNPQASNNPFLRRFSRSQPSSPVDATFPQTLPPESPAPAPQLPPRPANRTSTLGARKFDAGSFVRSNEDDDLAAALHASLSEGYSAPSGPPPISSTSRPQLLFPSATTSAASARSLDPGSQPSPDEDDAVAAAIRASLSENPGPIPVSSSLQPQRRSSLGDGESSSALLRQERARAQSDSPPPYTARPDIRGGEVTMEAGPARPFQNPVPPAGPRGVSNVNLSQTSSLPRLVSPQPTGAPRSQIDNVLGHIERQVTGWLESRAQRLTPRNLNTPMYRQRSTSETNIAVPGSFFPPQPSRTPSTTRRADQIDDRTPTTRVTPGRPLLRNGMTLVYPLGYRCEKCANTGYKYLDPLHPCKKCWNRFSRPYDGPLTYASWSNRATDSNFQQPLPNTRMPLLGITSPGRIITGRGGPEPYRAGSAGPWRALSPGSGPLAGPPGRVPPGALQVRPGDPRIGGVLCWNCGGDGEVSYFLFDRERCPTCDGMGRIR